MTVPPGQQDPSGVFLWARCGGGHRTAKEGVKQQKIKEAAAQGKAFRVQEDVDLTGDRVLSSIKLPFIGGLGDIGVKQWDEAQKKGDLKFLERYASWGWIGEIIFYPIVYFKVKWLLQDLKVQPDFVVSTQAFCLNAIMHAMQTVNHEKHWNMHMHVYLTDMPSKKAIHFFPSIRKVTDDQNLRNLLTLHAPPPLRKAGQTEADEKAFWKKHCGEVNVITNEQFPIREAFLDTGKLKKRLEAPVVDVNIKVNEASEKEVLTAALSGAAVHAVQDKQVTYSIRDHDKVGFLMLGSQPTTQSVLHWLNTFVAQAQKSKPKEGDDTQRYFFLYCGVPHTQDARNPLLDAVAAEIKKYKDAGKLPANFNIVPFTNQDADEIALMMARSDLSITRSGGATSMELIQLHQADLPKRKDKLTLIHSEALQADDHQPTKPDLERFTKKIAEDMATVLGKKKLLDEPDWNGVRSDMLHFCQSLGYSKKKSERIVQQVLQLYTSKEVRAQLIEEIFKDLEKVAQIVTQKLPDHEARIVEEMRKMQQKPKYRQLELPQLRQAAVENVLMKEGIVLWESGNAKYLKRKIGAHIVNPQYATTLVEKSFFA